MSLNRRNTAVVASGLALSMGLAIAGATAQSNPQQSPAPKLAEEQFKNIQVLKGVPADQVIPTMQFMTASLGVECEFCHVQGAFDKDDKKPKQTARKMIEMMFAINADNFDRHREVTCYSCHRGSPDPVSMPPVMTEDAKAIPAEPKLEDLKEGTGPTADQLLDKYLQAVGGAGAIDKVTSRVMKGEIKFGEQSMPIEIYAKDPEKRISIAHTPQGDSVTAFNGREGWLGMPDGHLREMHGGDIEGAAIDADLHLPAHLKPMFSELKVRGTQKIGELFRIAIGEVKLRGRLEILIGRNADDERPTRAAILKTVARPG